MGKKSDDDTAVILKKLGIICPSFYAMYYVVVVVLALAFGLECDDKDSCRYYRLPFYFDEDDFRPEGADLALVAWLGQVVVFHPNPGTADSTGQLTFRDLHLDILGTGNIQSPQ